MSSIKDFWPTQIVKRAAPEAVIYDLRDRHQTTITLPTSSTWTSGLHWHESHVEYLQVMKGSVKVTLDGKTTIVHAPAKSGSSLAPPPIVKVGIGVQHEWRRADDGNDPDGEDVVVIERTAPDDGQKTNFFWCVNGVILEGVGQINASRGWWARVLAEWMMWFHLLEVFLMFDNHPVMMNGSMFEGGRPSYMERSMQYLLTHVMLRIGWMICRVGGTGALGDKYIPPEEGRKVK